MTEIVAAHLERVAKELLDELGLMIDSQPVYPEDLQAVAAALAACAREEAKWWLEKAGRDGHFWIVSPIDLHPEDCRCEAHERVAALERAAGENK